VHQSAATRCSPKEEQYAAEKSRQDKGDHCGARTCQVKAAQEKECHTDTDPAQPMAYAGESNCREYSDGKKQSLHIRVCQASETITRLPGVESA
jgi:hypothetical protein